MKVFVSYGFNDRDKWIEDLVVPLVRSLGFEPITGQRLAGNQLVPAVDERLAICSACVAFTARRSRSAAGKYNTHPWVTEELTKARTLGIRSVEVREDGVDQGNSNDGYVWLKYARSGEAQLLVELSEILASWRTKTVRVQLVHKGTAREERLFIRAVLGDRTTCEYRLLEGGDETKRGSAPISAIGGGFFIDIPVPSEDALVQLAVRNSGGLSWTSFGDGLTAIPINLHPTGGTSDAN